MKYQEMFYSVFKYYLQNIILHSENKDKFINIKNIVENKNEYEVDLKNIVIILKNISEDSINFINNYNKIKMENLHNIENKKKLELPKNNLYNNDDNEDIFYYKYADEILRYSDLKLFYHVPDVFFTSSALSYYINENEIILFESFLNDYFKYFENAKIKNNVLSSTYDTSYPVYESPNITKTFDLNKSLPKTEKLINIVK